MKIYKHIATTMLLMVVFGTLLVACNDSTSNQIHMNETNFVQTSITIHKGEEITFVDDSKTSLHTIDNGHWLDTTQIPDTEAGAPIAQDIQVSPGSNAKIGPFNKAGTYHYYCTVHVGMNLTVIVK